MPTPLRSTLDQLAQSFANGVLAAVRGASLEDLLAESGGPRRGPGRPRGTATAGPRKKAHGRLARRSPEDIAKTLDNVVSAVRATRGKGLRAEEIRKQLGLDVREVPRVLRAGLSAKKLHSKGQKRATTYFAA
jgi:hypothetical protein